MVGRFMTHERREAMENKPGHDLLDVVVAATDWSAYRCGCGQNASHLPDMLVRLLESHGEQDVTVHHEIDSHVVTAECLHESALPATRALLSGLADGVEWDVYLKVTEVLLGILACETVVHDFPPVDPEYIDACHAEGRKAEWMFLRDFHGAPRAVAENIADIFDLLEEAQWFERLQKLLDLHS